MNQTKVFANRTPAALLATLLGGVALSGCGGSDPQINQLPVGANPLARVAYRATVVGTGSTAATQDLLTGGLGKSGLVNTAATPVYANPLAPTVDELRRNALQSNYRGLVDNSVKGGFGLLFGPNIDLAGNSTLGEGLVPGVEYTGTLDDGTGRKNVARRSRFRTASM